MSARPLRPLLAVLAALVAVMLAAPAAGDSISSARQKREEARARKAAAAAELDTLHASDRELERAVADLDVHVQTQEARLASARQAVAAAEAEVAAARARVAETAARLHELRDRITDRAVEAYVHPDADLLAEIMAAADLGEAARRKTLLDAVTSSDRDLVDDLRATEEDYRDQQAAAEAAEQKANERRREVEVRLGALVESRNELAAKQQALEARITEYRAEVDALAAEEAKLTEFIRERQAALRATGGVPGPPSASGLIWPVQGRVTSEYGWRWGRRHTGIDIGASSGTPIWAAQDGVVIYAGWRNGYGQTVVVDHGGGLTTLYAHQSRIGSREGQRVARGDVVGYVGSTGRSTGPHLHFETRVNGAPRNPRNYLG